MANNLPHLKVAVEEARETLSKQLDEGKQIRDLGMLGDSDLEVAWDREHKWSYRNEMLLRKFFKESSVADDYVGRYFAGAAGLTYREKVSEFRTHMKSSISKLERIIENLDVYAPTGEKPVRILATTMISGKDVLVVHGHDDAAKETVSRALERGGLNAIILHELPDKGRTIIEKLEEQTNVAYAIVLLTPDDLGSPATGPTTREWKSRARQNVIFELGMLVGKLGRSRVCVLRKDSVEIPSDYHGVIYKDMDSGGGWRLELAREIKAAGIEIDLDRYVS